MKRCRSGVMVNPPRVGKRKRPGRNPERTWRNRRGGVKDGSANVINSPNAVNGQVRLAGKSTREGSAEESPRPPRSGLVQHVDMPADKITCHHANMQTRKPFI